jgi:hypothetical protein
MDYAICITKEPSNWNSIFNSKLIFYSLTDEHALKLLLMQKIKPIALRKGIITIYLHDIELEEIGLHPKLYTILKYSGDVYGIFVKTIDNPGDLTSDEIEHIQTINEFIKKEYIDKKSI